MNNKLFTALLIIISFIQCQTYNSCKANEYFSDVQQYGNGLCLKCPNNTSSEAGSFGCIKCPNDYYSLSGEDCQPCFEGSVSLGGRNCVPFKQCEENFTQDKLNGVCTPTELLGYYECYSDQVFEPSTYECIPKSEAVKCKEDEELSLYINQCFLKSDPLPCEYGKELNDETNECQLIYSDVCTDNQIKNLYGKCDNCPKNKHSKATESCKNCADNYFSVSGESCQPCPNNKQSVGGQDCQPCPNSMQSISGESCKPCPEGQISLAGSPCFTKDDDQSLSQTPNSSSSSPTYNGIISAFVTLSSIFIILI